MFGLFKKKRKDDTFLKFCDAADDALMLCYEQRDIRAVVPYFSSSLLNIICEEIKSPRDLTQEYGIAKYRIRTWEDKTETSANNYTISKHLRHQNVSIHGMIDIPVGDNIDELWYVTEQEGKMYVQDIRRL